MSNDLSLASGLWQSLRPQTGLYAFVLSGYGFAFHGEFTLVALVTMCTCALITVWIMSYNDYVDAEHDQQKDKWFATIHRRPLRIFIAITAVTITGSLLWLSVHSPGACTLLAIVWAAGIWYSHIPHLFIVQNVVVALCSGSPALVAAAHLQIVTSNDIYTFALFTGLIMLSEVQKDIEDGLIDSPYKDTLATRYGMVGAMLMLVPWLHIVGALFHWHPNELLRIVALTLIPLMAYQQGQHLLGRVSINKPMATMNNVIKACGFALFAPLLFGW